MITVKFFRYVKNMYGNVNTHEMRMPTHYVDMTAEELEYDGAFNFGTFIGGLCAGIGGLIAGVAVSVAMAGGATGAVAICAAVGPVGWIGIGLLVGGCIIVAL